jgi:ABC-type proline/glycine betaine transport system substrate-binding protein
MEEMINKLTQVVGIDKATAEKVAAFLKDHADQIPKWLGGDLKSKLPGGLGKLF